MPSPCKSITVLTNTWLFILASIYFSSCEQDSLTVKQVTIESILDTINNSRLIAAFKEDDAFSIIVKETFQETDALKLTYRNNFPVYIDSLLNIRTNEFESKKLGYSLVIVDSTVNLNYKESMVHPCYTWQGQTPVQRSMTLKFKRIYK